MTDSVPPRWTRPLAVAAILLLAIGIAPPPVGAQVGPPPGVIPDQYIVVLRDTVARPADVARELGRRHGFAPLHVYEHALKGFAARIPAAALPAIARDPRVDFISEDREVVAFAETLPTGVDRINADGRPVNGVPVHVAVLDTGIDLTHPDLRPAIAGGRSCITGQSYNDGNGHGSHVAGIIGALGGNDTGVVGVAPGAWLWAVKVLNNAGSGSWSSVICGLDFVDSKSPARGGPIGVANLSLGGAGSDDGNCGLTSNDALHKAVCRVVADGVTVVAAAGNSGADLKGFVPAAYDSVIAVTALADSDGKPCGVGTLTSYGADDTFASFTNYATLPADRSRLLAAPGVSIYSTYKKGGYARLSGTSMAAPHVAGAAARHLSGYPGASPGQVLQALLGLAEPLGANMDGCASGGASHTDPSGKHPEPVVRAELLP
jgi:subtilisin family serine protease